MGYITCLEYETHARIAYALMSNLHSQEGACIRFAAATDNDPTLAGTHMYMYVSVTHVYMYVSVIYACDAYICRVSSVS